MNNPKGALPLFAPKQGDLSAAPAAAPPGARPAARLAVLVGLLALAGCAGYQVGTLSLYSPGIRTVYVPVFESDTFRRNLGERLTEAVVKEIELKTPYKVVGTPNADSILAGRITREAKRVAVENRYDDPREAEVSLNVQVRWIDSRGSVIRQCEPIPLDPQVVALATSATFFPEIGQSVATAHQQAIQRTAEQIVAMMESPW